MKILKAKDIVSFKTGKLDSNAAIKGGVYPFFTCSQETYAINSYAFDTECVLLAGNNAAGVFPLKYFKGKFNAYQRTYIIEPLDELVLDIKYFYYFLRPLLQTFQQQATGATTKFLTLKILNNLEVALPDITTQKKIAAILSAYDDLIENNKQRIKLLENMAEELYKEWFVRFRFPNWQNTEFEKGVPKGWQILKSDQVINIVKGKSYSSSEIHEDFLDGSVQFINLKNFNRGGGYRYDGLKYYSGRYAENQKVIAGDIVMAVTDMTQDRAVVGRVATIPNLEYEFGVISLDTIKIIPLKYSTNFTYCYFKYSGFAEMIKEFANGANVLHLSPAQVLKQQVLSPELDLTKKFDAICKPIFDEVLTLQKQLDNLNTQKNSLLPRLISGKLSVQHLNIHYPPSMQ